MRLDDAFPSVYLVTSDVTRAVALTIDRLVRTEYPQPGAPGKTQLEWVLRFREIELRYTRDPTKPLKRWSISRAIFKAIVSATGRDDSDAWPGVPITLFPTTVGARDGGNSTKPCIGVRRPTPVELELLEARHGTRPAPAPVEHDNDQAVAAEAADEQLEAEGEPDDAHEAEGDDEAIDEHLDDRGPDGANANEADQRVAWILRCIEGINARPELTEFRTKHIDIEPEDIQRRVLPRWGQRWNEVKEITT